MAKLTLSDLANLNNQTSAVNTINNNNAATETAIENTLSRDGTSPNQMGADLDLNGYDLINVGNLFLDGAVIEADVIADYVDFNEASEPANPSANTARLYAKDDGGLTKLYYKDSSGIEYLVSAPVFDIREYGAVGDGTTDDTTAIAAAIAAVPSTGGVVFVPVGTFLFKSTLQLKSKTLLTGQGWGSILKGDDIALSGNARIGIRESAASNVDMAVINLCVDISALAGDSGGHKAIQFNDSSRIRVEGCRIITTATGIAHVNCSFYKVINNKVEVTAGTADGGIDNWWGSHDAIIIGNHVDGNDSLQQGILFTGTDTTESLSTPCYNLVISNNILQHCTENGIWLQGSLGRVHTAIVEGNTIEDTSDGSNGFGVRLSQCDRVILRGNHIKDTQLSGICLRGEGGTTVTDCVVSGNIVEGANKSTSTGIDGAAIQLGAGGATGHLVIGNKIYGSLHARAIDIAAAANNNHVIGNYCAAGTQATIRDQGTSNKVQLNRGNVADFATLELSDSDVSHKLSLLTTSNLTADRTLTLVPGDANRTVTLSGDLTVGGTSSINGTAYVSGGTDVAVADGGTGSSTARGAALNLSVPFILGQSGVAASHTGNTNETTLATITVPAGAIGANGSLRVTTLWTVTNSANNKTIRVRLGGLGGTSFLNNVITTNATYSDQRVIRNRNSASSQVSQNINSPAGGFGISTAAVTTGTIDTSSAQDIVITAQLANSGETITLEGYTVELFASA